MLKSPTSVLIVLLVFHRLVLGQPEESNWYFGNKAALSFNNGSVTSTSNSSLNTIEGVSCISDTNGELLFYTNGNVVYNKSHLPMHNGIGLYGNFSTTQSSLIVKSPDEANKYFLFTVTAQSALITGESKLCYSVVDMLTDSGRGSVIMKNIFLLSSVCEKITATHHANGKDIWVAIHQFGNNRYFVFPINCNGIGSPVISECGLPMTIDYSFNYLSAIGCMKFSHDGRQIAAAWQQWNDETDADSYLQLADFNSINGRISNAVFLSHNSSQIISKGYGVEFSPNSSLLYFTEFGNYGAALFSKVYQYNLLSTPWTASEYLVASDSIIFGTIQLAPDNKLYIARYYGCDYLSAIDNPDVYGPGCSFLNRAIILSSGLSTYGLPNMWMKNKPQKVIVSEMFAFNDTAICSTEPFGISPQLPFSFSDCLYYWDNGSFDSVIQVTSSGNYSFNVVWGCDTVSDSVSVRFVNSAYEIGNDITLCHGDVKTLIAPDFFIAYSWSNGATSQGIEIRDTGIYALKMVDSLGCVYSDTVVVMNYKCNCDVFIPNAISANGDGLNDELHAYFNCSFLTFSLVIYNKWGHIVFSTNTPEFRWNGNTGVDRIPQDQYYWHLKYTSEFNPAPSILSGSLCVIR